MSQTSDIFLEGDRIPCPMCGEPVLRAARKCRWCGETLQKGANGAWAMSAGEREDLENERDTLKREHRKWNMLSILLFGAGVAICVGVTVVEQLGGRDQAPGAMLILKAVAALLILAAFGCYIKYKGQPVVFALCLDWAHLIPDKNQKRLVEIDALLGAGDDVTGQHAACPEPKVDTARLPVGAFDSYNDNRRVSDPPGEPLLTRNNVQ